MSHIQFSLRRADGAAYREFINGLRALLTGGTSHGIPVLRHGVRDSERFILVDLSNIGGQTVTVAIDVVNAYVVGYRVDNRSYFLEQDPNDRAPINVLFPGTERQRALPFTGHYNQLERAFLRDQPHRRDELNGREVRQLISLGIVPLHEAINNLRNNEHIAEALLVIIQMVSEAARFRFIEGQVRQSIDRGQNFEAGPATMGLENNWRPLSARIQEARADGSFTQPVYVESISNNTIRVDNVASDVVRGVALILYVQVCVPPRAGGSTNSTGASGSRRRHEHDEL